MKPLDFERIPGITAFISALAFVASVIHEFAFFSVIGDGWRSYIDWPDYFTLAIRWIPVATITSAVAMYAWQLIYFLRPRELNRKGTAASSSDKIMNRILRVVKVVSYIVLIICPLPFIGLEILSEFYGGWWKAYPLLIVMIILLLAFYRLIWMSASLTDDEASGGTNFLIIASFLTMGMWMGYAEGYKAVETTMSQTVLVQTDSIKQPLKVAVLRTFSQGYVIFDPKKMLVSLISKDSVKSIVDPKPKKISTFCDRFKQNVYCIITKEIGPIGPPDHAECAGPDC